MSVLTQTKRLFFGKPIATKFAHEQRLSKIFALPVFASDALSSVAYATEATMAVLAGAMNWPQVLHYTFPISCSIAVLIVIVASSYYQTLHSYPHGGGSYTVASDNLGSFAGRVAGASLLIDYVLTVSVSVTAGVLALVSMAPGLQPYLIEVNLLCVSIIAIVNLRGTKESGVVFAIPSYSFVFLTLGMVLWGLIRLPNLPVTGWSPNTTKTFEAFGLFMLLKAFANGCTALTGIEAISNGVQAFKKPESRNASITLSWMAAILVLMFLGTSWLGQRFMIVPLQEGDAGYKTVLAMICLRVFGEGGYFYALQVATALILILAANTAFADFPRLSSMIARDGFLPRQLASVGDRLVFQNGIFVLAILSTCLIVGFRGHTDALIPLYAIGVFTAFTLSQFGMVVHQAKRKKYSTMLVSLLGGLTTMVVAIVIMSTKITEGGWIVIVALIFCLTFFWLIQLHYKYLARELSLSPDDVLPPVRTSVLLYIPRLHDGIRQAVSYAQTLTHDVQAVHVADTTDAGEALLQGWKDYAPNIPLSVLVSSEEDSVQVLTKHVEKVASNDPTALLTVILPMSTPVQWWRRIIKIGKLARIRKALKKRKNLIVTTVPEDTLKPVHTTALLLTPRLHKGILQAISYAKSMARDVRALHVTLDPQSAQTIKQDWNKFGADMPLVILESPYRSLVEPVIEYIDQAIEENPDSLITIIVPQAVPKKWWQGLLHNNAAVPLKLALKSRKNLVITNVRYFLK